MSAVRARVALLSGEQAWELCTKTDSILLLLACWRRTVRVGGDVVHDFLFYIVGVAYKAH